MKTRLLLLVSLLIFPILPGTSHGSGSVDVDNCSYDPILVGNSSGNGITLSGHNYAGYRVIVRDDSNQPIDGADVTLGFFSEMKLYTTQSSGTTVDCLNHSLVKLTDASGIATFTPRVGGHSQIGFQVVLLNIYPLADNLPARSTDMDGDGKTALSDYALFGAALNNAIDHGIHAPEADFNGDGRVTIADFSIFAAEFPSSQYSLCP